MGQSTNILDLGFGGKMHCTDRIAMIYGRKYNLAHAANYFNQHFFWLREASFAINMPVAILCVGSDCRNYAA